MNKIEKNYKKPEMKFVSLQNTESVADPCWSPSVNYPGAVWYLDPNGKEKGYFSFIVQSSGKNCGSVEVIVKEKFNYPEDKMPTDSELLAKIPGGNNGQPFKAGSGIQDNPGGMS